MPREEAVRLFAVVELIIVRARIAVFVPSERVLVSHQPEEWPDLIVNVGLHQRGAEAAVILRIVNEQGRPRCAHRYEITVVLAVCKVCGVLLNFVGVDGVRQI